MRVRRDSSGQRILNVALKELSSGKVAKVGWFKSEYPAEDGETAIKVATVAAIQEYGWLAKKIPPRPMFAPTIATKQKAWQVLIERGATAILKGTATLQTVMFALGEEARSDVDETIKNLWVPRLSPATVQRRLARKNDKKTIGLIDKPLIDTGYMSTSLISVVEDE